MARFIVRAQVFHTPADPFRSEDSLEALADGAVVVSDSKIEALGDFEVLRRTNQDLPVEDLRDSLLIPGLVDTHVHYPQLPVVGAMGLRLLDWLEQRTLPEEARLLDPEYARARAKAFLRALARSGTTSALVFGAHFAPAMEAFFQVASESGLRLSAGLVVSDRALGEELQVEPEVGYREGLTLARRWHGKGRLRYAVTPRFSLSCSEATLEACGSLAREVEGSLITSHLNESPAEVATVAREFSWAGDYLETYERFGLVGPRSLYAHNIHATDSELQRLAAGGAAVCHCPSSNMFLGSGLFPLGRHLEQGVRVALGSDVGAGTGPGMLKEGLAAYQMQMLLQREGVALGAQHLLYLATHAGARALDLPSVGFFAPGMEFDAVVLSATPGSTMEEVWRHSPSAAATLAAAFTLAGEREIARVYVGGERVR